jgi:lipopolysaccharide/colanic/teichoic acid biosynthesis glycosyltransferase
MLPRPPAPFSTDPAFSSTAPPPWIGRVLPSGDALAVALGLMLAPVLDANGNWAVPAEPLLVACVALLTVGLQCAGGAYRGPLQQLSFGTSARSALVLLIAVTTGAFLQTVGSGDPPSAATLAAGWAVAALLLLGGRTALVAHLRRAGRRTERLRRVVVVGAGEQGRRFVDHLRAQPGGRRLIGIFDDRADRVPAWVGGYPVLGGIAELVEFTCNHKVDEVVLALPWSADDRITACLTALRRVRAQVRLCPDLAGFALAGRPVETSAGVPLVEVHAHGLGGAARIAKEVEDRVLALLAIVFCLPLLLTLALFLAVGNRGRVIVRETYRNFEGRPLVLHAFAGGREDDPSSLPALLARTHLRLLPRLFDILVGRVSLVGPHPHGPADPPERTRLIDDRLAPYGIKPGLISPAAQEHDEVGDLPPLERRLALEQAYAERWSLATDGRILLRALQ